jgi:hypothetical protein
MGKKMINYEEWIRGAKADPVKKRDWRWLLLLIVYTTIFTTVSWDLAYKRGFEAGQKSAEAPKVVSQPENLPPLPQTFINPHPPRQINTFPHKVEYYWDTWDTSDKKFGDEPINIKTGADEYRENGKYIFGPGGEVFLNTFQGMHTYP